MFKKKISGNWNIMWVEFKGSIHWFLGENIGSCLNSPKKIVILI